MPRRRSATLQFNAIRLVGGLLPASLIEQIARQEAPGQRASDYGLPKNLRIQVAWLPRLRGLTWRWHRQHPW